MLSSRGTVLKADVLGRVAVKAQLSGMPECRFGVNDRLLMREKTKSDGVVASNTPDKGIQLDDIKFH